MNADREHRLELSLRNCLALARRMQSKDPEAWGHVIRFCREAGIEPSILRDAEPGAALEARAAEIYDGFEYNAPGEKPPWVPGGNSFKQEEARKSASTWPVRLWPAGRRCPGQARRLRATRTQLSAR